MYQQQNTDCLFKYSYLSKFLLVFVSFSCCQIFVIATEPNIISKSQWNGIEAVKELRKQSLPIGRVIIVHTAGADCQSLDSCSQQVRNIQNYHQVGLNFDDIAYNFLIGNDGNVYVGRGWEFIGAAAKNYNEGSLSMAFIGTFEKVAPSAEALKAAQSLLDMGVSAGQLTQDYKLYGHRQLSSTTSPGAALYEIIKEWPHWSRNVA